VIAGTHGILVPLNTASPSASCGKGWGYGTCELLLTGVDGDFSILANGFSLKEENKVPKCSDYPNALSIVSTCQGPAQI
jgi:hypothetical protein